MAAGIRGRDLAALLGVEGRELREAVEQLRQTGIPIGAYPGAGYYWPSCMEEVDRTCAFLNKRAFKSLGQTRKMRRWARKYFGPQLNLFETAQ